MIIIDHCTVSSFSFYCNTDNSIVHKRMKNALFILLLIAVAYSEVKIDNGVLVLTDSNFQEAIKENPSIFIDFYSSVCYILVFVNV